MIIRSSSKHQINPVFSENCPVTEGINFLKALCFFSYLLSLLMTGLNVIIVIINCKRISTSQRQFSIQNNIYLLCSFHTELYNVSYHFFFYFIQQCQRLMYYNLICRSSKQEILIMCQIFHLDCEFQIIYIFCLLNCKLSRKLAMFSLHVHERLLLGHVNKCS